MSPQIDLANFARYVSDNIKRISDLYQEIEQVQYRFNDLYGSLTAEWQAKVEFMADRMLASPLSSPLQALLTEHQGKEREALEKRIAELEAKLAEKRAISEKAVKDAQEEVAKLRELNPTLDRREENLKARSLSEMAEIKKLEDEIRTSGLFARLFGNQELNKKLASLRKKHADTLSQLEAVRKEWQQAKDQMQARQTELRSLWETASVEASQLQAELDYLHDNLAQLAAKRGAQRLLAEMKEVPAGSGEWQGELAEIVEINRRLEEYRQGLTSVAEALGVLTGIRSGMERFEQSVAKVYEEQQRFNLRPLKLDIPKSVVQFHNVWAEFRKEVEDDKYLGMHPLEFSKRVRHYIEERLSEKAIADMFDSMGQALTKATKAWD